MVSRLRYQHLFINHTHDWNDEEERKRTHLSIATQVKEANEVGDGGHIISYVVDFRGLEWPAARVPVRAWVHGPVRSQSALDGFVVPFVAPIPVGVKTFAGSICSESLAVLVPVSVGFPCVDVTVWVGTWNEVEVIYVEEGVEIRRVECE